MITLARLLHRWLDRQAVKVDMARLEAEYAELTGEQS